MSSEVSAIAGSNKAEPISSLNLAFLQVGEKSAPAALAQKVMGVLDKGVAEHHSPNYLAEQVYYILQKGNYPLAQWGVPESLADVRQNIVEPWLKITAQHLFIEKFSQKAANPGEFHQFMQKVFGETYDKAEAEKFRKKALSGDFSWLPNVEFLDDETLQGANGAYDAQKKIVYLKESLKNNADLAAETFLEEAGHFLDDQLNEVDTQGDEGEMFRRILGNEVLSVSQIAEIREEDDRGIITVNGRAVQVEFWNPFKAVAKVVKKAVKTVVKVAKKVGGAVKPVVRAVAKVAKTVGKTVKQVVKQVVIKPVKAIAKGVGRTVVGVVRTIGSSIKIAKSSFSLFKSIITGDKRGMAMGWINLYGSVGQFFGNVGGTFLDVVGGIVGPFHEKTGQKLNGWSDKIQDVNRKIQDGLDVADQASHSIFYQGETLKPWQVKALPPQDGGPKGTPAEFDRAEFDRRGPENSDVTDLVKDLLEKNAPIVRQFAHDTYPMSTEDMLLHADRRADGSYDLHDSFADNPLASHAYKPKIYAKANKVNEYQIELTYSRYYPNSYISTGPNTNLPSETWHEGDLEQSSFLYDIRKGEIVAANVLKHGVGANIWQHTQDQIEFINGHPVVTVALGSHATGITGGLEVAPTKISYTVQKIFGKPALDRYATREEVATGEGVDLHFSPDDIIVIGPETGATGVSLAENDRFAGRVVGDSRHATYNVPAQKNV